MTYKQFLANNDGRVKGYKLQHVNPDFQLMLNSSVFAYKLLTAYVCFIREGESAAIEALNNSAIRLGVTHLLDGLTIVKVCNS